jgi:MoaA/NifB/PqqE/SkfB family radical SAM enzyme
MFLLKKTKVTKKILAHQKAITKSGHQSVMRGMQFNLTTLCNFKCEHCFADADTVDNRALTVKDIANVADQADELGVWEVDIQGGEPLMLPDLPEVLKAIGPERFYIYITTNGWLLDEAKAKELAEAGVDKISISIDYFDADKHDEFRKQKGSYQRAIDALKFTKAAGMTANINITVGHYNAKSDDLIQLLDFAAENEYFVNFNMAAPTGAWRDVHEIVADESDTKYLMELKDKYPTITRDLWAYHAKDAKIMGCPALNIFYINPNGDVLPCPYMPIRIGNITEMSLKDILKKGWQAKYIRDYSPKCLTGEDVNFINRYLTKGASVVEPMEFDNAFDADDLYDDEKTPY